MGLELQGIQIGVKFTKFYLPLHGCLFSVNKNNIINLNQFTQETSYPWKKLYMYKYICMYMHIYTHTDIHKHTLFQHLSC